jgi:hypothetical protein
MGLERNRRGFGLDGESKNEILDRSTFDSISSARLDRDAEKEEDEKEEGESGFVFLPLAAATPPGEIIVDAT